MTANPALGYHMRVDPKPSARLSLCEGRQLETLENRVARGEDRYGTRANKNPHAVALGHMTSPAKAAAAQANGDKGGRPAGS